MTESLSPRDLARLDQVVAGIAEKNARFDQFVAEIVETFALEEYAAELLVARIWIEALRPVSKPLDPDWDPDAPPF